MKIKRGLIIIMATLIILFIILFFVYISSNSYEKNNKKIKNTGAGANNLIDFNSNKTELYENSKLLWPVENFKPAYIGYPDIDKDGKAFNCKPPGYKGHEGTDIDFSWNSMKNNITVFSTLDGEVLWVFDGKYDKCPSSHNDCRAPNKTDSPNLSSGYRVCTELGPYYPYENYTGLWYWCFNGGNLVVIKHYNSSIFATVYEHLKNNSILVKPGDYVKQGQKIAEVGSAGKSSGPHLHFEVWGKAFYDVVDPWAGKCGPNFNKSLWQNQTK